MFKRITVLTLIASLLVSVCIGSVGFAEAESINDGSDIAYEGQELVEALGIINSNVDSLNNVVTREMFAVYMARMLKIEEKETSSVRYFKDLEYDAFSVNAINSLVERGIISVPDNHIFRPADYITPQEATKMIICVLGYGDLAEADGGFPSGYAKFASRLKISGYLGSSETFTVQKAGELIYNALCTAVYEAQSFGSNSISFDRSEDSFLKAVWNIDDSYGTIDALYGKSILDGVYPLENETYVDGVRYTVKNGLDLSDRFLNYVHYFYYIDKASSTNEILYVIKDSKTEDCIIMPDDYIKYSDKKISYYDKNEKQVTKNLINPVVVYNGTVLGDKLDETMTAINKGSITLKDSDNDNQYDSIIIEDYRGFFVTSKNIKEEAIYDNIGLCDNVAFGDYETVIVTDNMGNKLGFSDLKVEQVLSVAASSDKKIVRIIIESKTLNGQLKGLSESTNKLVIKIDDTDYKVDKMFIGYFKDHCEIGRAYTFTLDSFGLITYLADLSDEWVWGYMIGSTYDDIAEKTKIKLMTPKGEIKVMDCADKTFVDGTKQSGGKIYSSIKTASGDFYQVIYYQSNDDVIKRIDTAKSGTDENVYTSVFDIFAGDNAKQRWYAQKRLGIKALLDTNTAVFVRPAAGSTFNEEDMYIMTIGELKTDGKYICDAYKAGKNEAYTGAVVIYDTEEGLFNTSPKAFVVDTVYETIYNDEVVTALDGYQNGGKKTVYDDERMDFSGVAQGDILSFAYDKDGTLRKKSAKIPYDFIYDCSTKTAPSSFSRQGDLLLYKPSSAEVQYYRREGMQLSWGDVISKNGTVIEINGIGGDECTEIFDTKGYYVLVYDETSEKLYLGSVDDIVDKESAGENSSKVIIETSGASFNGVIVYNYKK